MARIATSREVRWAVGLAALAFVLANEIARRHPVRADWTRSGRFTLADRTRAILAGLREPVSLTAVLALPASPETPEEVVVARIAEDVQEVVRAFARASPAVSATVVDALRDPGRAQALLARFQVRLPNVVLVECGRERRAVGVARMAEIGRPPRRGEPPPILAFRGEEALARAVLSVSSPRQAVAYYTRGHGERDPDDAGPTGLATFDRLLRRAGFETRPLDTLASEAVPGDASLLVVAGPERPFAPREARLVGAALDRGGAILALLDPVFDRGAPVATGLEPVLAARGVHLGRDLVHDPRNALPFLPEDTFVVRDLADHPITAPLRGLALVLSRARAVDGPAVLLSTSPLARRAPSPAEPPGGAAAIASLAAAFAERGRGVVVGDSDLATNAQIEGSAAADFLLRAVEWLTRSDERLALPPRPVEQARLTMTAGDLRTALWIVLVVLPGGAATAGITLLFARRRRG